MKYVYTACYGQYNNNNNNTQIKFLYRHKVVNFRGGARQKILNGLVTRWWKSPVIYLVVSAQFTNVMDTHTEQGG